MAGWPILYSQNRIGYKGKVFKIYKFRTMYVGAEEDKEKYSELNEANGPVFKIKNDPRFHRLGSFLSHTGLDELPQFINIIKGEMAVVGPRPLPVSEAVKISEKYKPRQNVLPGIISPWIFRGYHKMTFSDWMRSDVDYVKKKSFVYDLKLVYMTVGLLVHLILRETFDMLIRPFKPGLINDK